MVAALLASLTVSPAIAQSATASLSGTVVDAQGDGIMNICVSVWTEVPDGSTPATGTDSTDSTGNYRVDALPEGEVRIFYYDCDPNPIFEFEWWNDTSTYGTGSPVQLTGGQHYEGYNVTLAMGSAINGTVTDESSETPLEGMCVGVFDAELVLIDRLTTDASGAYRSPAVRPSDYLIAFFDCNDPPVYTTQWWQGRMTVDRADLLHVPEGTEMSGVDAQLAPAGTISGRTTNSSDGAGVVDVCVGAFSQEGDLLAVGMSQADGAYSVNGVPAGEHLVAFVDCASSPTYATQWYAGGSTPEEGDLVVVSVGSATSGIDAVLDAASLPAADPTDPSSWGTPTEGGVVRWFGANRAETAAQVSANTFSPDVPVAYVATSADFPDALAGGPVAAERGGPVLLVERDGIPEATASELRRLQPATIVVLGGASVVAESVMAGLSAYTDGDVRRLAGPNRYSTAAAVSRDFYGAGVGVAYIATGRAFPDALSGGAAAALGDGPVLLTDPADLPSETAQELERLEPQRIVVLGGTAAVSDHVALELSKYTDASIERISGEDRFDTAGQVAAETFDHALTVYVATGANFPDALAGVPAAGVDSAPLLLVSADGVPAPTSLQLDRLRPNRIVVLGGSSVVSEKVARALEAYLASDGGPSTSAASLRAMAHNSNARVMRGNSYSILDLMCGSNSVGALAPVVVGAPTGQYAWWRQHLWRWNGSGWQKAAIGPWHYSRVSGGIGTTTTGYQYWIEHGKSYTTSIGTFTVAPGYYAIVDELYFDNHSTWSTARNLATSTYWCRAG